MKTLILLAFVLVLGGCWGDEKSKTSGDFMSTLTKCKNDCKMDKPFLGGKN